jgi:hypothetical protein
MDRMKIGVIFDDFAKSDKNYTLIDKINKFVEKSNDEICGFLTNISHKVIDTFFAYSNTSDISHFNNGILVATSLDTADAVSKTSVNSQKCLYIWNMDWLGQPFNFYGVYGILSSPNIKKIVRSQLQADIIKNNFNVEVDGIDEDFNLENIYEICQRK